MSTYPATDVVLSDDPRARFAGMGWVTFRFCKKGDDRTVPLHPEAETALKAILRPRPDDPGEEERWGALPVFSKRGLRGEPWDRHSYKKAWTNPLEAAVYGLTWEVYEKLRAKVRDGRAEFPKEQYPALRRMWLGDFRKAMISDTRRAGTDSFWAFPGFDPLSHRGHQAHRRPPIFNL